MGPVKKQSVTSFNFLNWGTAYRGYNALVALIVLNNYVNDPNASALEFLVDATIHAMEAIAPNSCNQLGVALNLGRAMQAGVAFFSGNSTIPRAANGVDVFNHALNVGHRLS